MGRAYTAAELNSIKKAQQFGGPALVQRHCHGRYSVPSASQESVSYVAATVPTWGEPRTRRSRRVVPLSPEAVSMLREDKKRQNMERLACENSGSYNLVFSTMHGTPLSGGVVNPAFKRALKRGGLPTWIRFHDLRHSAASLMIGSGVPVTSMSAILGHARTSTTLNTYSHSLPDGLTTGVAALSQAIKRAI